MSVNYCKKFESVQAVVVITLNVFVTIFNF